eukprot:65017_1
MSFDKYNVLLVFIVLKMISSKCYILPTRGNFSSNNTLNWSEAESYCLSTYNSHLLSIHHSNNIIKIANEIINISQHHHNFWIGLSFNYEWTTWSDGTEFHEGIIGKLHKINITNSNIQHITLKTSNANNSFVNTNGNNRHFWICNDSPIETTLDPMMATDNTLSNNNVSIISISIFLIIGLLFAICCIILVCSIIILKTCKYKILSKAKQINDISQNINKSNHKRIKSKSKSKSKSIAIDDRASVDEGIIDKLQRITDHNR